MDYEDKQILKKICTLLEENNSKLDEIQSELSSIFSQIPSSSNYDEKVIKDYVGNVHNELIEIRELLTEQSSEE